MIDTHLHLFDPLRHPFDDGAPYRPLPHECANWTALRDLLRAQGVERGVLVAPTAGYDHDMRPLVDSLADAGGMLRGVARLRGDESDEALDGLAAAGVVGVRLDLSHDGVGEIERLQALGVVDAWAQRRWFVQVQARAAEWAIGGVALFAWPVDLVVDHCGLPDPAEGLDQPGFAAVCRLAKRERTWVKLSGAFRFSRERWPHGDTDLYARRLVRVFGPDHCVWGSDWPFVRMTTRLDYGSVLGLLRRWVPDAAVRERILTDSARGLLDRRRTS